MAARDMSRWSAHHLWRTAFDGAAGPDELEAKAELHRRAEGFLELRRLAEQHWCVDHLGPQSTNYRNRVCHCEHSVPKGTLGRTVTFKHYATCPLGPNT